MFLPNLVSRWLTASSFISMRASETKASRQPVLRLNSENEFHISIFSDLHYGEQEYGWGIDQDINSTRVINNVLDDENPDFVIINGDLITGENTFLVNSTKYLDVIVQPMLTRNVPWASTYGNHDSQFNLSREALFQEENKHDLSYTQHSPPGIPGVTNYYLPIFQQKKNCDGTPVAILWYFDSQGGASFQGAKESIPSWVEPSTAAWFLATQKAQEKRWGKELPSLAFVHIPPSAFLKFQENVLPNVGDESGHFPGLNDDVPLDQQGNGWQDVPFMQALVDTKGMHSVYSGHDHGDAWCGNWPEGGNNTVGVSKPHICFCKHTGYGGYGTWNRGSRNLRLSFYGSYDATSKSGGMEVETWVRMEDGEVVQRVGLNSTYGIDTYPTADGQ